MPVDDPREEFESVVQGEARRLHGIALAILRDAGEAEDAVQETMERAWRSWASLRRDGSRRAWLTRICVRRSIDRRRRFFRAARPAGDLSAAPPVAFRPEDVDLDAAYRHLSTRQRAVVALHYGYGHSLDECAALMGCRPGTARSHLARALAALREELGDD